MWPANINWEYIPAIILSSEMPESPIPSPPREPTPPRSPEVPTEEQEDTNQEEPMESQTTHTNDSQGKRRKRRRKLVPKTYLDDDGFMGKFTVPMQNVFWRLSAV